MQHFKDPQLRGGWFFYGPYCIKSLDSSQLQSTLSVAMGLLHSLSTVETNSSFVSTLLRSNQQLSSEKRLIFTISTLSIVKSSQLVKKNTEFKGLGLINQKIYFDNDLTLRFFTWNFNISKVTGEETMWRRNNQEIWDLQTLFHGLILCKIFRDKELLGWHKQVCP